MAQIKHVTVHNVQKITDLEIDFSQASLALIGGKNGNGKTSALNAILMTLCGKRGMDWPDVPLKEGKDHGECVIELTPDVDGSDQDVFPDMKSVTIRRIWDRNPRDGSIKESLTITDESGQRSGSPQQILNDLFQARAFNPLSLAEAEPKTQRAMLMDLVGLTEDFERLKTSYDEAYQERASINRQGVSVKARFDEMTFNEEAPNEEESIRTLLDTLRDAEKHNSKVVQARQVATTATSQLAVSKEDITKKKAALQAAEELLVRREKMAKEAEENAASLKLVELDPIQAKIDSLESDNAAARSNQLYHETKNELEQLRKERDKLDELLLEIPKEQKALLETADWPVADLSVDDKGVLYRGLPEAQASLAERIRLWCRVSAALHPKLRVLIFNDGNALDYDSQEELDTFLEESGFKAIVEYVTRNKEDEDRCVVVLEDGHALEPVEA